MVLYTTEALSLPSKAHQLDEVNLLQYLKENIAGFPQLAGSLQIRQFSHGQSNPTFLLEAAGAQYVLRKKPPGKVLNTAHAVDREFRVLAALSPTPVPVPRPMCLCEDASVIGTPFYVMEYIQGRVFTDPNLPELSPPERAAAFRTLATTLAQLHSLTPAEVGLESYGRPTGYCARQVWRWKRQYFAQLQGAALPEMQSLIDWLEAHVPPSDADPSATRICHGDYRLDNLVLDAHDSGRVRAVLDWELSTLGHPLSDLAYSAMMYHLPKGQIGYAAISEPRAEGIPSEQEYVEMYCRERGIPLPDPQTWAFCMGLSLFRGAAILSGVGARAAMGNASAGNAAQVGSVDVVRALAQAGLRMAASGSPIPAQLLPAVLTAADAASGRGATGACNAEGGSSCSSCPSCSQGQACGGQGCCCGGAAAPAAGFEPSARARALLAAVTRFIEERVRPVEDVLNRHAVGPDKWTIHPVTEELKAAARKEGLWNLFLPGEMAEGLRWLLPLAKSPDHLLGAGLSNLEYAFLSEAMGRCLYASEVFNCNAPDTGNMEVLARYGTKEQQERWLLPLLEGRIRSCFAMTEPAVASSDATNIQSSIRRDGDHYVLNGRKWWTTGAMDPRCKICIFMGKTNPTAATYRQQSMVLVPMDAPGVTIVRPLEVFGYDDAPNGHAEVDFKDVRVPANNILLGEGRGFEIAQGRLGPGRLHHCMRLIGMGERALEAMAQRALARIAFRRRIAEHGGFQATFAQRRIELDAARLVVLAAAHELDRVGNKAARNRVAAAKVFVPGVVLRVVDDAMQAHGAGGLSNDFPLAALYAHARTLRIADGPDEVHLASIARIELQRISKL